MRHATRVATVALLALAIPVIAAPRAYASLPECDQALPGSAVLAAVQQQGIQLVCEPHPNDGRHTTGWWDGNTIHLWVAGLAPARVREIAAHELGHAYAERLTLYEIWGHVRGHDIDIIGPDGASWTQEDFAEMFSLVNFPEQGVGYSYYFGPLTDQQRQTMADWWAGAGPRSVQETVPPASFPTAIAQPAPPPTTEPQIVVAGPTTLPVVIHVTPAPSATPGRVAAQFAALALAG